MGRKVTGEERKIQKELDQTQRWNQKNRESEHLKACCTPPEHVFNYINPGKDQCEEGHLRSWVNKLYGI